MLPPEDAVQNGQQEGLRLSRSRARGHYEGSPAVAGEERLFLMQVERRIAEWPMRVQEIRGDGSGLDQGLKRSAAHEVPRQRDVGTAHDHIGLGQVGLELLAESGIEKAVGGAEKPAVLGDEVSDG
jgi:hypothetical protein